MVKKYDAIDWQAFSQKKNIEEIAKNTRNKNNIELTATCEIALVVLSIAMSEINVKDLWIWKCLAILAMVPIIILLIQLGKNFLRRYQLGANIPSDKEMVDLFDNEICYYVLMAESYSRKIEELDRQRDNDTDNNQEADCQFNENREEMGRNKMILEQELYRFNLIEACFYIHKVIDCFAYMNRNIDKIFSKDGKKLYSYKKISLTRLKNVLEIVKCTITIIDSKIDMLDGYDIESNFAILYKKEYKQVLCAFIETVNTIFKTSFDCAYLKSNEVENLEEWLKK